MIHRPALGPDPERNRRLLQETLESAPGGKLELPPGTHRLSDGLRVPSGWTLRGAATAPIPTTRLESLGTGGAPVLHVTGSDVTISDVGLLPPPADPGEHGGDRGTAITVGEYLYREPPSWISGVDVRRVHVDRPGERNANCVAVMGAVRDVTLHALTVRGGYTGVAVHWGAVGADVATISGPTYHPHHLTITNLRVRDAIEGFYLSSVHDVTVRGACLRDVEFGFRLLPGDNTDRWVASAEVGSDIEIAEACVRWHGPNYGVRVAGWGRSEVDGVVSELRYANTLIRDCRLTGAGQAHWSPVLVEQAPGVELRDITISSAASDCCPLGAAA